MKFAFHLHAMRPHWRQPAPTLEEQRAAFTLAREAGFDGLDISDSWPLASLGDAAARQTRALAEDLGLCIPVISCMGKTLCHPELGEANERAIERALALAPLLGASTVNLALSIPRTPGVTPVMGAAHSPGGSLGAPQADFDLTSARLRRLARQATDRGLALSIELHDRSLADTSASLLRLLDGAGEANLGANPDLCNGYRAYATPPESWEAALDALAPRMNLWHVNNMQRVHFPEIERAAFVERPLHDGDVDYRLAHRKVREAGFDGWVVIEYKGRGDALATTSAGRAYLAGLDA